MNVTRESDSPTEVTLSILMDSVDEEPYLNRSYRRVVSRLQIPGFRPGKAPRSIVEAHVGRTALVQEALEFMIPESLDKVLKEQDIKAFAEPELEVVDLEPVSFKAVVPLEPEVDLGEIDSIHLERDPVEVSDEQIDHVLQELRFEAAPWEPVERAVAFGDLVTLNVKGIISGEQAIDDEGVDFIPQQDNQLPLPGFSIHLEGMTDGQEKEFILTVPEDYPQEIYAGKECQFQVEVLAIKEKQLPELDDEFAKGVREGYESLEALTDYVRQRLTDEGESTAQRQLEQNILEALRNQATIQASQIIYQRELESIREDRERALRNQRMDMDSYLGYLGQTEEEWRELIRPEAEQRLNTFLVIRKLADQEGLEVQPAEVDEEIDRLISASGSESQSSMRMALDTDNAKDSIRSSLLNRKVMARLVEIVEGDGSAKPQTSDSPEAAVSEVNEEAPEDVTGVDDTGVNEADSADVSSTEEEAAN